MEPARRELKLKVCVVGPPRVGKSSLIRRFVYDQFDEKYLYTIGANVSKRVLDFTSPEGDSRWSLVLTLWDIMGEKGFLDLLREAYFHGASGVVAVADLTRPETFEEINVWVGAVKEAAGQDIPAVLLGNKLDLVEFRDLDWAPLVAAVKTHGAPLLPTSSKTAENVNRAFTTIAELAAVSRLRRQEPPVPSPRG